MAGTDVRAWVVVVLAACGGTHGAGVDAGIGDAGPADTAPADGPVDSSVPIDGASYGPSCTTALRLPNVPAPYLRGGASVVADFNNDGKADLAVPNAGGIAVALGHGDGTFSSPNVATSSVMEPTALAVADFDGDGNLDIVFAARFALYVARGAGDGTFATPTMYAVYSTDTALAVRAVDVDGNNRSDLIVTIAAADSVAVLLNKGDGTFNPPTRYATGSNPVALAVADVTGDGVRDIVVGSSGQTNNLTVLTGATNGTFVAGTPSTFSDVGFATVELADIDRDGVNDLVFGGGPYYGIEIALGTGTGTFGAISSYPIPSGAIAIVDLDGDGVLDIVGAGAYEFGILKGAPDGTFTTTPTRYVGIAANIAAGNLDNTGNLDLVLSFAATAGPIVLLAEADGSYRVPDSVTATIASPFALTAGDFDEDGQVDVVIAGRGASELPAVVEVFSGASGLHASSSLAWADTPGSMVSGDLDGDGHLDLVFSDPTTAQISVLAGHGDGTFSGPKRYFVGGAPGPVAIGDIDGDGHLDVVVVDGIATTGSLLRGSGNGDLLAATHFDAAGPAAAIAIADVDRNGAADVVVANSGVSGVFVLLNQGNGTLIAAGYPFTGTSGLPSSVQVADFDGDGKPDIATADSYGGLTVLWDAGDPTPPQSTIWTSWTGDRPRSLVVADFDGDGRSDLAVGQDAGSIAVVLGSSTRALGQAGYYPSFAGRLVGVADVDRDRRPDLISAGSGALSTLLNRGCL